MKCDQFDKKNLRYYAYALETCPTTGKKHLQGFAYSWKSMRLTAWKKIFPGAHIEQMRGNFRENEAYCSKEADLVEFGEKPNENGARKDLSTFTERITKGERVEDIALDQPNTYVQYRNGLVAYENIVRAKKERQDRAMPKVYIRVGEAGSGKTRWLDEQFGLDGWRFVPDNTGKWFDGCDARDVICFDDVEINQVPSLSLFKRVTDRYCGTWPIKGGFITKKWKAIVFTSNHPPNRWWKDLSPEDEAAVMRRIFQIELVYKDHTEVIYQNPECQSSEDRVDMDPCEEERDQGLQCCDISADLDAVLEDQAQEGLSVERRDLQGESDQLC